MKELVDNAIRAYLKHRRPRTIEQHVEAALGPDELRSALAASQQENADLRGQVERLEEHRRGMSRCFARMLNNTITQVATDGSGHCEVYLPVGPAELDEWDGWAKLEPALASPSEPVTGDELERLKAETEVIRTAREMLKPSPTRLGGPVRAQRWYDLAEAVNALDAALSTKDGAQ